jgi:hypothetical protein
MCTGVLLHAARWPTILVGVVAAQRLLQPVLLQPDEEQQPGAARHPGLGRGEGLNAEVVGWCEGGTVLSRRPPREAARISGSMETSAT